MFRILSIDGGGIRGIIPALILAKIEKYTGQPISSLFHLIAGTSTGGILALGLATPDKDRKPQFPATALAHMYEHQGSTIFSRPAWRRWLPVDNLFDQRYTTDGIESVLEAYFGNTLLSEALTNLLVTSYEIERRFPFFFRSSWAMCDPAYDFPMKSVARATSAAPTYFEPCRIPASGPAGYYALIDGGVFANNPAMCALTEAQRNFDASGDVLLVSIGTGIVSRPLDYDRTRHWGVTRWTKPLLDIVFDGVSSTVDYQLSRQLNEPGMRRRYYRIQPVIDPSIEPMDNASPANIRHLILAAESAIWEHHSELREICDVLLDGGVTAHPKAA